MSCKIRVLIPLLLLSCAAAQEQSSIAGRVFDATTGQPLNRAHVRLLVGAFNETPTAVYGAMSDSDGRFSISPIPPGSYIVQPVLTGYFYLPKSFTVVIKPGERVDDFRIELTPRAILSGRVLDERGEPVKNAAIWGLSRRDRSRQAVRNRRSAIDASQNLGDRPRCPHARCRLAWSDAPQAAAGRASPLSDLHRAAHGQWK
jgi:hypothetical protein